MRSTSVALRCLRNARRLWRFDRLRFGCRLWRLTRRLVFHQHFDGFRRQRDFIFAIDSGWRRDFHFLFSCAFLFLDCEFFPSSARACSFPTIRRGSRAPPNSATLASPSARIRSHPCPSETTRGASRCRASPVLPFAAFIAGAHAVPFVRARRDDERRRPIVVKRAAAHQILRAVPLQLNARSFDQALQTDLILDAVDLRPGNTRHDASLRLPDRLRFGRWKMLSPFSRP